jgi:hypothetical protein
MEHVLIWPSQYPMLLRGLVEQNGAFILDALESWPSCSTNTDEQGVKTTVLPPIFYLQWLKPLEPFESCYFQHIDEYDEQQQAYTQQLFAHIEQSGMSRQALIIKLLECFAQYSDLAMQIKSTEYPNFFGLLIALEYAQVFEWCLAANIQLTPQDVCTAWLEPDFRAAIETHLDHCLADRDATASQAAELLLQDAQYYGLLEELYDDKDQIMERLEQALLEQICRDDVKQPELMALIAQGAKGTARDVNNKSALMWAIEKGFVNVAEKLIEHHDGNDIDATGQTFLHFAVQSNLATMINLVLDTGIDAHKIDETGQTPYRLALKLSALVAKKTLEQRGIKELSESGKLLKIKQVHVLYALVSLLLPLQFVLFFSDQIEDKSIFVWGATALGLLLFGFARTVRKGQLYPTLPHPWSLKGLMALSWFSVSAQVLFALLVLSAFLRS